MIISTVSVLLAVFAVGLALKKWHIPRDRNSILSAIRTALQKRKSLWAGVLVGVCYLAIFMVLGGKGGRIHILFGRVIWNTTPGEMVAGLALAVLLTISVALSVHAIQEMPLKRSAAKDGVGLVGAFLALLACFCP